MKIGNQKKLAALAFALAVLSVGTTNAQTPNAYGYSTGYGTVYGSYGLASTMQSMYNVAQAQMQRTTARNAMIKVGAGGGRGNIFCQMISAAWQPTLVETSFTQHTVLRVSLEK